MSQVIDAAQTLSVFVAICAFLTVVFPRLMPW